MEAAIGIHARLFSMKSFSWSDNLSSKCLKMATAKYGMLRFFFITLYILYETIPKACDKVAIVPDNRKRVFFRILIKRKGVTSVDVNINVPNIMACLVGAKSKLSPEAA